MYIGSLTFRSENGNGYRLEAANVGGGRLVYDADERRIVKEYHHKDHLGNVRVAFTDRNEDGKVELLGDASEITQQNDFYPFGLGHEGFGLLHGDLGGNRYRFNGKELNEELGLYDYGARWYDPAVARWSTIDPLADAMPSWSPYNYVFGNPILFSDPTGMVGENSNSITTWIVNEDTDERYWVDDGFTFELRLSDEQFNAVKENDKLKGSQGAFSPVDSDVSLGTYSKWAIGASLNGAVQGVADGVETSVDLYAPTLFEVAGLYLLGRGGRTGSAVSPMQKLLAAANRMDRNGLTQVGRALQKHGSRKGSKFPRATGNPATMNQQGEKILSDIINNPAATSTTRHHARFGNVLEIKAPNGQGARFSADGKTFIGLIE